MKKQTLLGAAALTTLAVAGAANAGTLTNAPALTGATVKANHVVASEVTLDSTSSKGKVGLALTPSTGGILPSGNAILTVTLTGGAKFGDAVTAAAVIKNTGACAPTAVVSSGGGASTSSVTFLVSELGGCTNTAPLNLLIPVQLTSTSAVNVETNLTTEAGTAIDGGKASTFVAATSTVPAKNLISFAKAFDVEFEADDVLTAAKLSDGFKSFVGDTALGTAEVVATGAYNGIHAAAAASSATDVVSVKFTVKGDLSTVDVLVDGDAVNSSGVVSFTDATNGVAGTYDIEAAIKAPVAPQTAPYAIKGSAYTVQADLTLASGYTAPGTFGPAAIQSITREGSSYLLPWVASGTLSTTSTSNTVVRIANTGAATGAVSVELLTSSTGVPASTGLVPVAASIAKGGELVLTSASLQTALGADFGRGDIRVTVEGQPQNLIVRRFVQSTVNGALSEVSLGRTAGTGNSEPVN
ncbi:hypothetical protein [Brevundimonas sp. NPDC046655]|uniref:hypothetical protein n=1 Tax=unclassified Brevundimonas TaxID=2622653 RepID=UPI00384D6CB9